MFIFLGVVDIPEVIIELEGTDKLRRMLNGANAELNSLAEGTVQELADMTVATAQALAPKDLGMGAMSIHANVQGLDAQVVLPDGYMVVMELGRRPGSAAPPVHALEGWASRHGIAQRNVYALARSIGRKGIRARRFMHRAAAIAEQSMIVKMNLMKVKFEQWWSNG